jgi:predicted nucleic acid-binding protein
MIWIVDASVAVRWFIEEEAHPNADKVLEKLVREPETFAVPELFAFEVSAVLQRLLSGGLDVFRRGIIPLLQGGLLRQPMTEDLAIKANRFVEFGLTGYDACYAALAEDLMGIWLTFDEKAHKLIKKNRISCFLEDKMPKQWD